MTAVETGSSLDREMIANFPAMLPGLAFQTYIRKNIDVKKAPLALQPLCFFLPPLHRHRRLRRPVRRNAGKNGGLIHGR